MQNQNLQPWTWGQAGAPSFPTGPVFPSAFSPAAMDQNQMMTGYQQMYGATPSQPPPDYGASQWSAAQIQHWQQWQQWQEKYQEWQAQYGKKYAETIAAMGQNPSMVMPGVAPPMTGVAKPSEVITNPGYTTANPPPLPSNAQPVPPPPPEEEKPAAGSAKERVDTKHSEGDGWKESPEELSEAEKTFDIQFKQWEDQFNEWKKQNQDHPDKAQYREYEKKWETWREQLLQRREQMRKKRLSKVADVAEGKPEEPKTKPEEDRNPVQAKLEPPVGLRSGDSQPPQSLNNAETKPTGPFGAQDGPALFPHQKPPDPGAPSGPAHFPGFPNMDGGGFLPLHDGRFFDRENPNFGGHGPGFGPGPGPFDPGQKFRMDGNRDRFDGSSRGDFPPRRPPFGNGNFDGERGFGGRFAGFDNRKPVGQDRFGDGRLKDGRREFGPTTQLNEQAFTQAARNFQDRSFGDGKPPGFNGQNSGKSNASNSFPKPKVPSLFDITVEKPPGLKSPGKDRKPKIWEQEKDNYYDGPFEEKKEEKGGQRNESPWLSNPAWANNSPWIKPWELDRVVAEKPPDANLRADVWQKETLSRGEDKPWGQPDGRKTDAEKSELSGYVGKILAKLGNFMSLPGEGNHPKMDDSLDGKRPPPFGQNWPGKNDLPNPAIFNQEPLLGQNSFGRDYPGDKDNRKDDVMLFGRGDCDDRIGRFDRDGRREDRGGPFPDDGRHLAGRGADDDRFFGKGDRNSFPRDDRPGKFNTPDDVDERVMRNRNRDRDDRFRGLYDRDERRNRGVGSPFDRFGRNDPGGKEPEWNPQVFDYSKGNQPNFRSRFPDPEDNFRISTVVDYSHGENKQTFDYGHGEVKGDSLPVKSFDYGHGRESPAVIDYGHGSDRDAQRKKDWKKDSQEKSNERDGSRSKSKSPQRSRSPRGRLRSRSRSPPSGGRGRRDSKSPPFKGHRSRSRDRFNRQGMKRNRRNNSEEKSLASGDGDPSKNSFDVTTVLVEDLICSPGREVRPNKLVFIMRGLPGSGKTYVTKLIKDKEVELGGDAPRILSLDDYFMTEVEKEVVDEESGRKMKKKVLEYEYESCAEPHYRGSLLKAFKKTISDGFFSFIIVDSVNEKTKDYEEMWSFAKQKGFQVYVAEMDDDVALCTKRNIHKRTEKEISELAKAWEKTPNHYLRLDVRSLLQADAITEVEMEVVSDTDLDKAIEGDKETGKEKEKEEEEKENKEDEDEDEPGESAFVKSRWDHIENSEQKLDRLDGLKRRREGFHATMQDYLQLPDDFDLGSSEPADGKKKVRWADLEERRQQEKMRAIGFVVGQTDWSRMTDPTFGESALTRTKYI